jgi:hypothetical protein
VSEELVIDDGAARAHRGADRALEVIASLGRHPPGVSLQDAAALGVEALGCSLLAIVGALASRTPSGHPSSKETA